MITEWLASAGVSILRLAHKVITLTFDRTGQVQCEIHCRLVKTYAIS